MAREQITEKQGETQKEQAFPSLERSRLFSVAPMLDWTDRHYRVFARQLSRHALLYTEMVTTGAIIHGKGDYLAYSEAEHPLALQLGAPTRRTWPTARASPNSAAMTR